MNHVCLNLTISREFIWQTNGLKNFWRLDSCISCLHERLCEGTTEADVRDKRHFVWTFKDAFAAAGQSFEISSQRFLDRVKGKEKNIFYLASKLAIFF